jgi:NitT/TauT family transport system substrate-binding protein
MEVYQVRVFLEVARQLSFTEAADALNLTQPAVSAKIKSLESELGTPLFYRLGRKIQLTEVGQFLFEEGPKLIQIENQLLQTVEEIKKGKFGNLKIGCTSTIAHGWLPEKLFAYRQHYPNIQTQCLVFDSAEYLYRAITSSQVDLGISNISFAEFSEISSTPIDGLNYAVFLSPNHPLAQHNWLSLQDLKNHPWVILPTGSPSQLVFESRLSELGLSFDDFPQIETVDTSSLMRTYILQGNYLGFGSTLDFQSECESGLLVSLPLQEFALSGTVYLLTLKRLAESIESSATAAHRRSSTLNPTQKFIDFVQPSPAKMPAAAQLRSPSLVRATTNRPETITLSIGVQNSTIPGVAAGLIIQRLNLLEHFLPKEGRYSGTQYHIRWCDFSTGAPIVAGLQTGQLNIGVLGDYPLLLSALPSAEGTPQQTRLVSFTSINPDGSCNAVIVPNRSQLQNLEDLRGKVLAVPFGSSAHGMVIRSLNAAHLLDQVKLASLEHPIPTEQFNFSAQWADGYAHFAPFHDIACHQGNFRYLLDDTSKHLPAFYGVSVSCALAEHHPEIVIAYLKALAAAQHWYDTTPIALSLVSRWSRLETEIVHRILSSAYHKHETGRFFSEMSIRPDWLSLHIAELSQIPGNEQFKTIDLDRWIQTEFLHQVSR